MPMKTMLRDALGVVVASFLPPSSPSAISAVRADDLVDDLRGRHVAGEPGLARRAEGAVHAAAGLRGDAQGDAAGVAHQHRLDQRAVVQPPEELDRVAPCRCEPADLGEQRREHLGDELLAAGLGQVAHVVRVGGPVLEVVRRELLRPEGRDAQLLRASPRAPQGEVGQVRRRLLDRAGEANWSSGRPSTVRACSQPSAAGRT